MKKLNDYRFIIILVIFTLMAVFFPLTGEDLFFSVSELDSFNALFDLSSNGILTNLLTYILTKYKLLKIVMYGILGTSMFLMIKNTVGKNNGVTMFIALFFLFLMDKTVFSSSIVQTNGFISHFVGSFILISFINIINRNLILKIHPVILFLFGFIGTSIGPVYSVLLFIAVFVYMMGMFREKYTRGFLPLFSGMIVGIVLMVLNSNFAYTGYSYNLLHVFIPKMIGTNFLIVLILSALILFSSIKVFVRENRVLTGLSMIGIIGFLFASLLSTSYVLHYLMYVVYLFATYYLLGRINKSRIFKKKMKLYYGFKVLFIVLSCIFGCVYEGSLLFVYLIDIILILELYNYILPSEFLDTVWIIVAVLVASANIYIYRSVFYKHKEMNVYIENKLECSYSDFVIPTKYKNDYLYKYIPSSEEELEWYLDYYDIDVYNKDRQLELKFRE